MRNLATFQGNFDAITSTTLPSVFLGNLAANTGHSSSTLSSGTRFPFVENDPYHVVYSVRRRRQRRRPR